MKARPPTAATATTAPPMRSGGLSEAGVGAVVGVADPTATGAVLAGPDVAVGAAVVGAAVGNGAGGVGLGVGSTVGATVGGSVGTGVRGIVGGAVGGGVGAGVATAWTMTVPFMNWWIAQ